MNLMLALATPEVKPSKGASIYDVRSGWGDGGPKKAEEWNKISDSDKVHYVVLRSTNVSESKLIL